MYKLMTPGPTQVAETVRLARSVVTSNPDLDPAFVEFYHNTCKRISRLMGNEDHETLILSGEAILGLEAACASLTEPGDRVLIVDNGLYGAGFADFVRIYGGRPTLYTADYRRALDPEALRDYLAENHDFKYATLVHCDTPSGILNDISRLCPLLNEYGILSVVDSVSAMFGEPVDVNWGLDILCGGSQKALSAPPGLSFLTISPKAKAAMEARRRPVASFYANLLLFQNYYEEKCFPYTMPISDIYGLSAALDMIEVDLPGLIQRHRAIGAACRKALQAGGLRLYQESGFSNTVTVFCPPDGLSAEAILAEMLQTHNIMLAGSFGPFKGKVLRIGHMGENCKREDMAETLEALSQSLERLGFVPRVSLRESFSRQLAE